MKKFILIAVIIFLAGVIATYLFFGESESTVRLIKLKATSGCYNLTKNYCIFSSGITVDSITATPATERDLISFESDEFIYQVKKEDGDFLNFRSDSMKVFLNDKLISVVIEKGNGSYDWLKTCTKEEVKNLRSIFIADSIPDDCMPGIKRFAEYTSNLGLYVDNRQKNLPELIKLLDPIWIFPGENCTESGSLNAIYESKNLEMIALSAEDIDMSRLSELPKLRSVMVFKLDSSSILKFEQLPENVTSLEIFDSEIGTLNFLEGCTKLRELNLISCPVQNIQALKNLTELQVLSLIGCDSIADLSPLSTLNKLKWLTPPWNINEKDLEPIVRNSPDIETLNLCGCKYLKSLTALRQLKRLSNLSIVDTPIESDSLVQFQKLKFLSFDSGQDTDSLNIIKLRTKMPNTLVIPAEPFCMGSGWLIVFFVLVITGLVINIQFRKRSSKS